jgi:nitrate/TMAO reductase-like tetraheme cytochrome c subunit
LIPAPASKTLGYIDLDKQERTAQQKAHTQKTDRKGETCIECHQGIAHELPEGVEASRLIE